MTKTISKMRYEGETNTLRAVPENYCLAAAYDDGAVDYPETMRRIVACVNACAGIPTEALEAGVLVEVSALLRAVLDWGRDHTSPRDPHSPHDLLVSAVTVLDKLEPAS